MVLQVYNEGPGVVTESLVTIYFPYEVANGKWLLYMTEEPMVENDWGYCEWEENAVNELGLKVSFGYGKDFVCRNVCKKLLSPLKLYFSVFYPTLTEGL